MNLKRRLERLEPKPCTRDDADYTLLTLAGKTEDDVIGVSTERSKARRDQGEPFQALVDRARAVGADAALGLPVMVCCLYEPWQLA